MSDNRPPKAYDRDADDRGHGILTNKDWELLLGSADEKHDNQYRRRLRQRFRNAMLDFCVLFDKWNPAERDQAFIGQTDHERQVGERKGPGTIYADREIYDGCVAFVALLCQQYQLPLSDESKESFRALLVDGIERSLETMDPDVDYEVVLEIKPVDQFVAEAREKYEQGESLGVNELMRLIEAGEIPPDDIPLRRPGTGGGDDE